MGVVIEARDEMIEKLLNLAPGSDEQLKQAQAIKILSEVDLNDRKLEFEIDKEETRKLERSYEYQHSELDRQLMWIDRGLRLLEIWANPLASLRKTAMNNKVRIQRDVMGYQYEETGVIGSHTFNNAQKDKYD